MATMNKTRTHDVPRTHEGAPAKRIGDEAQLRRSVMACLLWEHEFYEDGASIAERIAEGVRGVSLETAAAIAIEAREQMHLRHVPLWIVREMARSGGRIVGDTLARVIQRADELNEFMAMYWSDGKTPLSAQVKRGLAEAFTKFDAYQLAKYDRAKEVRLRDVLFLCHPKPKDQEQASLWKSLVDGTLASPDTWETSLSSGGDKKDHWERLLGENRLGGMALLRNLRNMQQADVSKGLVRAAIASNTFNRVLPFRFLAAAEHAPEFEADIDAAFLKTAGQTKIPGRTMAVIDVSGSMNFAKVSARSDMTRMKAACALGAILREACDDVAIYATAGDDWKCQHATAQVPARRGMALIDAIATMPSTLGGGGIFLTPVCDWLREREKDVDTMIVITDEQDCAIDGKDSPAHANPLGTRNNYLINVSSHQNGIGYGGKWTHIDGWSEAVVRYIQESESGQ